jgi:hypothetical protein
MTIIERALELVPNGSRIGLGSGRARPPPRRRFPGEDDEEEDEDEQ